MKQSRRDFVKKTGMVAAATAITGVLSPAKSLAALARSRPVEMPQDDVVRSLMMAAINTAKSAGASYSDVRLGRYRQSFVFTREQQIVNSGLFFGKEDRNFASTEGSVISQTIVRVAVPFTITAVAADNSDFQTRGSVVQPAGRGWEYVLDQDLVGNAGKWAEEAVQKLTAKSVDVGRYDLVLHPTHLWLTIHESIAHPTELDRALGYEANYAGTSFVSPPEKMLGKFRYGPEFMNIQGDRSQEGACATIGYDDEGVKPETFLIIKNGVVNDYQTTREQAAWLKWWYDQQGKPARSHGCSNADSWGTV